MQMSAPLITAVFSLQLSRERLLLPIHLFLGRLSSL